MQIASLKPMLAQLVRELPEGNYIYEPKWDGFRCLAGRDAREIELLSRHGRPLGRPDREPRSCLVDQLDLPASAAAQVLETAR